MDQEELARICSGLNQSDTTPMRFLIFYHLSQGDQPVTKLSLLCGSSTASMTSYLDGMEGQGLIKREHSAKDRRMVIVSLTPFGSKAFARATNIINSVN